MSAGAAAAPRAACNVSCEAGLEGFDRLRPEWDRLCDNMGGAAQPFWRAGWVRAHVAAFERPARLRLFAARWQGELVAALPLLCERAWLRGLPVRRLRSPTGHFSARFDLPALPGPIGEAGVRAIASALASARGWDVLELRDVPENGAAEGLARELAVLGHPTGRWPSCLSPFIQLDPAAAAPRPLSRNLRAQLGKHRRQLEAAGLPLSLARLHWRDEAELRLLLDAFYRLEDAGWKGKNRSSILARPGARRFCDQAAAALDTQGAVVLHRLQCGARLAAMSLGFRHGDTFYAYKWAYDEDLARYGTGHLLIDMMLHDLTEASPPLRRFDFTGGDDEYKQKWTSHALPHAFHLAFRRGAFGRALHALKFRWSPLRPRPLPGPEPGAASLPRPGAASRLVTPGRRAAAM